VTAASASAAEFRLLSNISVEQSPNLPAFKGRPNLLRAAIGYRIRRHIMTASRHHMRQPDPTRHNDNDDFHQTPPLLLRACVEGLRSSSTTRITAPRQTHTTIDSIQWCSVEYRVEEWHIYQERQQRQLDTNPDQHQPIRSETNLRIEARSLRQQTPLPPAQPHAGQVMVVAIM